MAEYSGFSDIDHTGTGNIERNMKRILFVILLLLPFLLVNVRATGLEPPAVPESGEEFFPDTQNFGQGLQSILRQGIATIRPDLVDAARCSISVLGAVILVSVIQSLSENSKLATEISGAVIVASVLMLNSNSLIGLGDKTVRELSDYGKLLLPVMTAAMAAQGGITASAALYAGTAAFSAVLSKLIAEVFVPMIYVLLTLATASAALGQGTLKNMRDMLKSFISWSLKTILTVFTTYMSITGVVSGSADAAALKATKVTIASVVPVVGGILSDASEAVLVGASLIKNSAGIYGIFAILAVCISPFLRIGVYYIVFKITSAVCEVFASKRMSELIGDFSNAMGLLLGLTGSVCLLLLISTICFMRGVS